MKRWFSTRRGVPPATRDEPLVGESVQRRHTLQEVVIALVATAVGIFWVWWMYPYHHPGKEKAVSEGLSISRAATTAVEVACYEKALRPGLTHEDLGLAPPASYTGAYVGSVTVAVRDISSAQIAVRIPELRFQDGDLVVPEGRLVYRGVCRPGQSLDWAVDGGGLRERPALRGWHVRFTPD